MKILLVSHFFPPTHNAGAEKRTFGYALSLLGLNHEVQVLCADKWEEGKKHWNGYVDEIYQDIPVRRIHLNWKRAPDPNRYLYNNPVVEQHVRIWLEEWKPDVVHITSCLTLSASVINAAKAYNIPVVLTLTDFWFICPRINLIRQDVSLCDGRTTPWECLEDMFEHSVFYNGITSLLPPRLSRTLITAISRKPFISRIRGFRGKMRDMEDRKRYLSSMLDKTDVITTPSKSMHDVIINSGVRHPIKVINSGHDLSWLKSITKNPGNGLIRLGYVGQIIPLKGLHVLISAIIKAPSYNSMKLKIYGSKEKNPEYMSELYRLVNEKPDIPIEFLGEFPSEQLGRVLSSIDILVVPSLWIENNPRVIQEAFASKIPVIASNVGGISEFVHHEKNGLLFERGNVMDLAMQFQRLVVETDLLDKLKAGIPKVKTIEEEVSELDRIYFELIQNEKTRRFN